MCPVDRRRYARLRAAAVKAVIVGLLSLLAGCKTAAYYSQLAEGQYAVLAAREPIARLVADPATSPILRTRLQQAAEAREFASARLDLPRNGSYTRYSDVQRHYVLWNVLATPEFSLQPVTHCFPIAGCVAYRGYYRQSDAEAAAQQLQQQGYETYVGGVPAYSTLGWFDDPILNTMLYWDDDELDGTIFHELAHQRLYVKGDSEFNESFASFVEREGLRQWRAARDLPPAGDARRQRQHEFAALILDLRRQLEGVYTSGQPPAVMRQARSALLAALRERYRLLRDTQWQGYRGYDAWMSSDINNAKLLPFGLYDQWVPAFAALYAQSGRQWPAFYAAARKLGAEPKTRRHVDLRNLAQQAPA